MVLQETGLKSEVQGLFSAILKLGGNSLTKHESLMIEELIINQKTGKEIADLHWLLPPVQKRLLTNGLKKLNQNLQEAVSNLADFKSGEKELNKELNDVKIEMANLKWELEQTKNKIDLPSESCVLLSVPLEKLEFSTRIRTVFKKRKLYSVSDLVKLTEGEFYCTPYVGKKGIKEIETFFAHYRLSWGMNI